MCIRGSSADIIVKFLVVIQLASLEYSYLVQRYEIRGVDASIFTLRKNVLYCILALLHTFALMCYEISDGGADSEGWYFQAWPERGEPR